LLLWKDLEELDFLNKEIEQLERRIENYRPAEIVSDSVRGSSATFPYTEHRFVIEGIEKKPEKLTEYTNLLRVYQLRLNQEITRIEEEIQKIPFAEIRMIIRYKYIEKLTYVEIMHKMGYKAPETPRLKLRRFMKDK